MNYATKLFAFAFALFLLCTHTTSSQIRLPHLVSDGMVLQRDSNIKIWGWAAPGESVTLLFKNKKYKAITKNNGKWEIMLKPQKPGGPYQLVFKGTNEITVNDVLFGDVWLCAGQSNMVNPIERVKEKYPEEVAAANYPEIRNFFISTSTDCVAPAEDLPPGEWKKAVGDDGLGFSSVSYFFAKKIYAKYGVPIGLINSSVGGTPIEAWMSEDAFKSFPAEMKLIERNKDTAYLNSFKRPRFTGGSRNIPKETDMGLAGPVKWYDNNYEPKGWNPINIPGYWEDQGVKDLNGVVWYRKEINLPESMAGKPGNLYMGRIVDADFAYVNGKEVGNITYQYPPRRYTLPEGLLKAGKNTIVMRVINNSGKGGFVPDKPYNMVVEGDTIDLKGTWQYKVGEVYKPFSGFWGGRGFGGFGFNAQNQPTALYNAMIAPFTDYKLKGILWYQGESNTGNPEAYAKYMPALIEDWRKQFNQGSLPFLYVQLANFMDVDYLPGAQSNWAELRNAQLKALKVPNTAMTVIIDQGEWNDIHPLSKKPVGERLALAALKLAYGEDVVYSGPIYKSSKVEGNHIIIEFTNTGSGLISSDGEPLNHFEIAGADMSFEWADARIEGNTVVVSNDRIEHPEFVRYAWADNPRGANLYNKEGLPASPFRNYEPEALEAMPWHGKKAAVVLTYDDAVPEHLANVLPVLSSLNLKATFYVTVSNDGFKDHLRDWKWAANNGYELGNHTMYHPCEGDRPGREWVKPDYDLNNYTKTRLLDEIKMTNAMLQELDGQTDRTFAYTCGDMEVEGESFVNDLKTEFTGARSVGDQLYAMGTIDVFDIAGFGVSDTTGEELIKKVKEAQASGALLVFLFHGVGGGHGINVSQEAHDELVKYLKAHENEIWVTTMKEAVKNINANQKTSDK